MRARSTVSANFAGSSAKPGASTSISSGMEILPTSVSASSQNAMTEMVSSAKWRAASGPSVAADRRRRARRRR